MRAGTTVLSSHTTGAGAAVLKSMKRRHVVRLRWSFGWSGVMDSIGGMPLLVEAGYAVAPSIVQLVLLLAEPAHRDRRHRRREGPARHGGRAQEQLGRHDPDRLREVHGPAGRRVRGEPGRRRRLDDVGGRPRRGERPVGLDRRAPRDEHAARAPGRGPRRAGRDVGPAVPVARGRRPFRSRPPTRPATRPRCRPPTRGRSAASWTRSWPGTSATRPHYRPRSSGTPGSSAPRADARRPDQLPETVNVSQICSHPGRI